MTQKPWGRFFIFTAVCIGLALGVAGHGAARAQQVQVANLSELNLTVEQGGSVSGESRYCIYGDDAGLIDLSIKAGPMWHEDGTSLPYSFRFFGDGYQSSSYPVNTTDRVVGYGALGASNRTDCLEHGIRVAVSVDDTVMIGTARARFEITVMPASF